MYLSCSHGYARSTLDPLWCMVGRMSGRVYSLTHIASDQSDRTTDAAQRSHTLRFLVFFFFSVWFIRWLVCAPFNHYYFHWLLAGWGCGWPDAHSHDDIRIVLFISCLLIQKGIRQYSFQFFPCVILWLFIYLILIGGESSETILCTTRHWTA